MMGNLNLLVVVLSVVGIGMGILFTPLNNSEEQRTFEGWNLDNSIASILVYLFQEHVKPRTVIYKFCEVSGNSSAGWCKQIIVCISKLLCSIQPPGKRRNFVIGYFHTQFCTKIH